MSKIDFSDLGKYLGRYVRILNVEDVSPPFQIEVGLSYLPLDVETQTLYCIGEPELVSTVVCANCGSKVEVKL